MEASAVSIDEVRALVAERQRYDDWLGALEAKRAETPLRVYERVQSDYRNRRDDVTTRLQEHVEMLSSLRSQLEERLQLVNADLTELEDARAEAMLRTAVGEFDSERWEQVRRDVEENIAQQTGVRSSIVSELDEVRDLLASASATPHAAAQEESNSSDTDLLDVEASDVAVEQEPIAVAAAADNVDASSHEQAGITVDEVSAWEAVLVDNTDISDDVLPVSPMPSASDASHARVAESGSDNRQQDARAGAPAAAVQDESFDDLAFLRSVVDSDSASSGTARAGSSVADQQKTLRCTDCGTMNLPTEWYCERCGGELAAF